jgi:predicted permease
MWRRKREQDLERELRSHLDLETEERGGDHHAAMRAFGNTTLVKEDSRAMWRLASLERIWQDVRLGARMMRRRPVFAAVAILSLAVGIGANTAVFSFVNAVVLKTLPAPGSDRFVLIRQANRQFGIETCCFKYGFFKELRKQDPDFEDMLAFYAGDVTLTDSGQTERLRAEFVSGDYFRMLGVRAAAGRLLEETDDGAASSGAVCVISYRLWQERFGGKADVVGKSVLLDREPFQIVGVAQAGFTGTSLHEPHDLQIPPSMLSKFTGFTRDNDGWAQIIARLRPGVRMEQAQTRLNVIGKQIQPATYSPSAAIGDFLLRDGSQGAGSKKEQFGRSVLLLLILVGVLLLIACANLAALLLVRSVERAKEAGMRIALGASKSALFRHFLAESLLLSGAGGMLGWLLALFLIPGLLHLLGKQGAGLLQSVQVNLAVLVFSIGATLLAGMVFGMLPAWRASRADPLPAIHGSAGKPQRRPLISHGIIAAQVALSLALLFCAGLFAQTLRNLRAIDLGFRPENLVTLSPSLRGTLHDGGGRMQFFEELRRRVAEWPETRAVSMTGIAVLSGNLSAVMIRVPGNSDPGRQPTAYMGTVSPGYFRTMGIPLLAGRDFTDQDSVTGGTAVIVNEQFARQILNGNALGKTFQYGVRQAEVIGVVGMQKYRMIREDPQSILYLPYIPPQGPGLLQVRTAGDPGQMIERLRRLLKEIDPRVPIESVSTMEMQIDEALGRERMVAFLSEALAGVAVALTAIGLYGVLAFSVVRRTREIGIRLAVGAERRRVVAMFLRESAWTVLAGMAAGIPLALGAGRLAASLLYGLKPQDAATAILTVVVLSLVSLTAVWLPAFRASRVDPMTALRHE